MTDSRNCRLLVTAFEPFGGRRANESLRILHGLADEFGKHQIEFEILILPVLTQEAGGRLVAAMRELEPRLVLMLGEADRATVCIERVALNLRDYSIADNAGVQVVDEPVVEDPDAPPALFAPTDVKTLCDAVERHGVPCRLSLSAGSYVCNEVMYRALHASKTGRAYFVHVPVEGTQTQAVAKALAGAIREVLL